MGGGRIIPHPNVELRATYMTNHNRPRGVFAGAFIAIAATRILPDALV